MFVKPAPGRAVRWPGTLRLLKEVGENVPETSFWLLAVKNGDVVKTNPPSSPAAAVSAPAPTPLGSGTVMTIPENEKEPA